jgi:hypothetical protein
VDEFDLHVHVERHQWLLLSFEVRVECTFI